MFCALALMEAMNNIFPEYYVLRVSQFDATKEPASDLDEWMRYLKVGFIDPETKVPGLREAKERLDVLKMDPVERKRYEDYRFERHYDENMLKAARYVGREEGIEKGREEEREAIARKMLEAGANPKYIKEITGIDIKKKRNNLP